MDLTLTLVVFESAHVLTSVKVILSDLTLTLVVFECMFCNGDNSIQIDLTLTLVVFEFFPFKLT